MKLFTPRVVAELTNLFMVGPNNPDSNLGVDRIYFLVLIQTCRALTLENYSLTYMFIDK
jgi:hypothetical protein